MATKKEIDEHLKIAMKEIGEIKPWFDEDVNEWIFSHHLYPVEYGGGTEREVIRNFPKYMKEFIKWRLDGTLADINERMTFGHGGKREGAGRPKGTTEEPKTRIYIPLDLAQWFKSNPQAIEMTKNLMKKNK